MIVVLEEVSKDSKGILQHHTVVPEGDVTKDDLYAELFSDCEDEIESLTE